MKKDSFRSWVVIVMLGFALTLSQMDKMLMSVAAPVMLSDLHLSGAAMGTLLGIPTWTYLLFQFPSGIWVDRFGARTVLAVAFVLWSLTCALTGVMSTFVGLLACRLALGMFEAPFYPTAHATMAEAISDKRRGLATAIYTKGASVGPACGAIVGTYLLTRYGWAHMFVIWGTVSLVFVVPWLLWGPRATERAMHDVKKADWATIRELLSMRAVWGITIGYFGFLYLYYINVTWLPTYLAKARGMNMAQTGSASATFYLSAIAAGPIAGILSDWLISRGYSQTAVRKSFITIGLLMYGAIVPAAYASDSRTAAILLAICLAGQAVAAINMLAIPSAIAPKGHAGLVGAIQQISAVAGFVSPFVTGVLFDQTQSFKSAIVCAGCMLVLSFVCFVFVVPRIEPILLRRSSDSRGLGDDAQREIARVAALKSRN
jgi:MFS family permease